MSAISGHFNEYDVLAMTGDRGLGHVPNLQHQGPWTDDLCLLPGIHDKLGVSAATANLVD